MQKYLLKLCRQIMKIFEKKECNCTYIRCPLPERVTFVHLAFWADVKEEYKVQLSQNLF